MKVLVFGANGKTGEKVVEAALRKGHHVTVFVRDAGKIGADSTLMDRRVDIATGDATNPTDVRKAMLGQEAVIDAIGGASPYKDTELERSAVHAILGCMEEAGVKRLVVVSMMGIGDSVEEAPFWYRRLMMPTFLRGATKDKTAMEEEVKAHGVEFVIARPPLLTDGEATGSVKVIEQGETGHKITRADLAEWMVAQLGSDAFVGQAVTVVNS